MGISMPSINPNLARGTDSIVISLVLPSFVREFLESWVDYLISPPEVPIPPGFESNSPQTPKSMTIAHGLLEA
ncbi:predicted protein [Botrytis cinerea T4]|uniref:Uncharacterized protein n=1 Tax=Botryotinia fuckeliana (strain T4) TaxID=999810 RepID=G2XZY4_BOTF4|nr:predicted protein [Botrytis cinerea T4]